MNGSVVMSQIGQLADNGSVVSFDAQDLPAGVYSVTVKTDAQTSTQKVVILK